MSRRPKGLPPLSHEDSQQFVLRKLGELQERKFHGRVTLMVQEGHVLRIEITESFKLTEETDGKSGSQSKARREPTEESAA